MEGKKLNYSAPLLSVRSKRKVIETPPPRKQLSVPLRKSMSELNEVSKPAAVPFVWERSPGRPKDVRNKEPLVQEEPSTTPRFPPGRAIGIRKCVSGELLELQYFSGPDASPLNENVGVVDMNQGSASEDEDDAVSDELDTLSQTDSFSWNCSSSGLSSTDGPFAKSSATFRADPKTRDLMMTRFLPAARAMIIETPKYVHKKKPVEDESPRNVKKVVSGELRPLLERYGSNAKLHHSHYKSEIEADESDDCDRKSGMACGMLPRLSVKKSLRFFDTTPRIKSRPQSPISSAPEVKRMARTAHSGPLPQILHEKQDIKDTYWNDIKIGVKQQKLIENKFTGVSNQARHSIDFCRKEGLSPRLSSRTGCISPYRNEKPQSPFHEGARFLGVPKIVKNAEHGKLNLTRKDTDKLLDFSAYQIYKRESDLLHSLAEKTLYIDLVNNTELPICDSVTSEPEMFKKSIRKNFGESRGTDENDKPKSYDQVEKVVKSGSVSSHGTLNLNGEADNIKDLNHHDQDLGHEARSLQCSLVYPAEKLATKTVNAKEVNDDGNVVAEFPQLPLPPPKSPSEPWLWRNLSSISLRNPFSQGTPKKKFLKNSSTGSKWETIVKTSNVSYDHKRYSEELISHVSKV